MRRNGQWAASAAEVAADAAVDARSSELVPIPITITEKGTAQHRPNDSRQNTAPTVQIREGRRPEEEMRLQCSVIANYGATVRTSKRVNKRVNERTNDDGDGDVTEVENGVDFNRQREREEKGFGMRESVQE